MTRVYPSRTYDMGGNQPQGLGKVVPSTRNFFYYKFWIDEGDVDVTRTSHTSSRNTPAPACPTDDEASLSP
ncbi:hypothetical protein L210DRAFT_949797 [Boletus edulis BED1]|uniref:Uncharacterized protein n=1 Tax=Boletus edulis BED1 TaxID=1328754 RepID=A0AAD4BQH6_BOLED|nr:hypothetical protein L210DRAFT_949797 [Boletus edulis BED1]